MSDSQELKVLGVWGARVKAFSLLVLKYIVPAIAAAYAAYSVAAHEARTRAKEAAAIVVKETQVVKDKAEASKQEVNHKVDETDERLLRVERWIAHQDAKRARRRPPPVVVPVTSPKKLSATTDEALAKAKAQAAVSPPATQPSPVDTGKAE